MADQVGRLRFFCAVCTSDIDSDCPRQAPLGKHNALVNVCDDCFDEPARERRDHQVGYDTDRAVGKGSMRRLVHEANVRLGVPTGGTKAEQRISLVPFTHGKNVGFEICRVPRGAPDGSRRDQQAAWVTAKVTWGAEVTYIGQTLRYFVFQRPNPIKLATSGHAEPSPLEAIAQYQTTLPPDQPRLNKWKARAKP